MWMSFLNRYGGLQLWFVRRSFKTNFLKWRPGVVVIRMTCRNNNIRRVYNSTIIIIFQHKPYFGKTEDLSVSRVKLYYALHTKRCRKYNLIIIRLYYRHYATTGEGRIFLNWYDNVRPATMAMYIIYLTCRKTTGRLKFFFLWRRKVSWLKRTKKRWLSTALFYMFYVLIVTKYLL